MKRILHLISSPRGAESFSIRLGHAIIEKLKARYNDVTVDEVNLIETHVPHLDTSHLRSFFTPQENLTQDDRDAIRYSDEAIEKLMAADIVVIGAPLYNFGVHSSLKAWIDHIARAGKTFSYSENGPAGLVTGKKVYIAMASGGVYTEGLYKPMDFVSPYLKSTLGFLGMTDLEIFRVEGVNVPGVKEHAFERGVASIAV